MPQAQLQISKKKKQTNRWRVFYEFCMISQRFLSKHVQGWCKSSEHFGQHFSQHVDMIFYVSDNILANIFIKDSHFSKIPKIENVVQNFGRYGKSKQLTKLADNVAQSCPILCNILRDFSLRQHIGGYRKLSQHFGRQMLAHLAFRRFSYLRPTST